MQRKWTRAVAAVLLATMLVVASPAYARKSEVQRLQEQIRALEKQGASAGKAYSKAYWALDATRGKMAKVDRQIAGSQVRLSKAQASLSKRADHMYRTGGVDYLGVLLTTSDFNEMLMRWEYVQRMGTADAKAIADVKALQAELEGRRAHLETLKAQQGKDAEALRKQSRRLQGELRGQQVQYNRLQRKLRAAIAAERRRTGGTTAYRGPSGMVFPVQGANHYSNTWGAARSHGRRHKGTDIMARTGVPVVAVLSGTVRAKSGGLGGKCIYLTSDKGWTFYYAHLSGFKVSSGHVRAGQVIGYVGATGNARGGSPHLHFEIHRGGSTVNPFPYLRRMW